MKERKFKRGLQRRIELITNILNIWGNHYDYREIIPKFRRNKPENDLETAQIVTQLAGLLSTETRMQMLPWVDNVQEELDRLEEEQKKDTEEFGVYENLSRAFSEQETITGTEADTIEPAGTE